MPIIFTSRRLDLIATVASLVTCGLVISANWSRIFPPTPTVTIPKTPILLAGASFRGEPQASLVLMEFSDYECPYCGRFARDTLPALEEQYIKTGKARLVFRHLPIQQRHPNAMAAAATSICADRQGRFWEMHDLLFADQRHLDQAALRARAERLGLDMSNFDVCLSDPATVAQIRSDIEAAVAMNVTGTQRC